MKRTYKNIDNLAKNVSQVTAQTLISQRAYFNGVGWEEINNLMTDEIAQEIADLLGGRNATKETIVRVLTTQRFSAWYLERIIYDEKRKQWTYCAGQDYPYEIKQIRNDLRKR